MTYAGVTGARLAAIIITSQRPQLIIWPGSPAAFTVLLAGAACLTNAVIVHVQQSEAVLCNQVTPNRGLSGIATITPISRTRCKQ
jgi:hypothetical protein